MCFSLKLSRPTGKRVIRLATRNSMRVRYDTCHWRFAKSFLRRLLNHNGRRWETNFKEGKRRTVIKRLKTLTSSFIVRLTLDIVDSYYGTECCSLQFFCEQESKITLLKLFKGEHDFLNSIRQSNDRLTKLYCEFDYVRLSLAIELLLFEYVGYPNVRLDISCILIHLSTLQDAMC